MPARSSSESFQRFQLQRIVFPATSGRNGSPLLTHAVSQPTLSVDFMILSDMSLVRLHHNICTFLSRISDIGRFKISTIKNIKARDVQLYRRILASELKGVLEAYGRNYQEALSLACRLLFLLPPILLRKPDAAVPQRLDAFLEGDLKLCTRGLLGIHDNYIKRGKRVSATSRHQAAVARVFDGQYAKAIQALTSTACSTTYEDRKAAMLSKHPQRTREDDAHIQALPPSLPSPPLDEQDIYNALRKPTRKGIAPGPNGDRFEYLQNTTVCLIHTIALHLLTKFANLEKEGNLPPEWYDYNTFSVLVAHGEKMRSLGMGSTGRKLVTAATMTKSAKEIQNEFAPFQLGCMIKNVCEAVVHLIRQLLHDMTGDSHVIISIDVSNAFNTVSRLQGLLSIAQSLPSLYTYTNRSYSLKNKLWMDGPDEQTREPIPSEERSTQGAVDGGVFFNTALNHVLKEVNSTLEVGRTGAFEAIKDDIVGCVTPEMARRVLDIITQRFNSLNLRINYDKCVILADSQTLLDRVDCVDDPSLSRIKTTTEGIKLLGAAISKSPEFHATHVQKVIGEANPVLRAITEFGQTHLQQALALLRASYMTKFSYLTRVTPPDVVMPFLQDILTAVRHALQDMISEALNDTQWGQCLLKPRLGGIGIIEIVNTAPGAYYASVLSCLPVIAKVDEAQKLGLNASSFDSSGLPLSNQYGNTISVLHGQVTIVYDEAMEIDRNLSLHVLDSLSTETAPRPGAITPPDKEERVNAVNALAAAPSPPPRDLMNKAKKLQSLWM